MHIHVKTVTGQWLTLNVEASDTVETLKGVIEDIEEVAIQDQSLAFEGLQLEYSYALGGYNIQDESTLHMLKRPVPLPSEFCSRRVRPRFGSGPGPSPGATPPTPPQAIPVLRRSQPIVELMKMYGWAAERGEYDWQCTCTAHWGCFPTTEE